MNILNRTLSIAALFACLSTPATAMPPAAPTVNKIVKLDGVPLLGVVYSLRDCAPALCVSPQLYYAESADDGATWGAPVGVST